MAGCQVVRLSGAGASLVRRGEMGVAVLLVVVVRRVNYSEQLQFGRWVGGRNWSSDEKMVVDKNLWKYFNPHKQFDPTHRCQERLVCWCLLWRPEPLLLCQTPHPSSTPTFSLTQSLSSSFSLHISNLRVHQPLSQQVTFSASSSCSQVRPPHGRSTTSAQAGQAGTEPWSWWSAHVRQPVHSTHSSSSFSPFCQHTTCSLPAAQNHLFWAPHCTVKLFNLVCFLKYFGSF